VLSTGEPSLGEFLPHAQTGQLVRMVDIPAQVQPASALETIEERKIDEAASRFYAATREYHGTVGYEWLQHLTAIGPAAIKAELKTRRWNWLALPQVAQIKSSAHPQVVSVINRFALVAAVVGMAIEAGKLPWSIGDTDAGIIACMARWLSQRGNTDAAGELLQEIRRRRQALATTMDDRLIQLARDGGRLVPASAADHAADRFDGFVKDGRILLKPEAWHRLWAGLDLSEIKKYLLDAQLLIPSDGGDVPSPQKFKSGAKPAKFYVLAPEFVSAV
jgi:hypothetical protein